MFAMASSAEIPGGPDANQKTFERTTRIPPRIELGVKR
jgi:hypothetical protein